MRTKKKEEKKVRIAFVGKMGDDEVILLVNQGTLSFKLEPPFVTFILFSLIKSIHLIN